MGLWFAWRSASIPSQPWWDPGYLLANEGGYLHTVGDYPSYDLVLHSDWLPALLPAWRSGRMSGLDPLDRMIALRIRAEFEHLSDRQLRQDFGDAAPRGYHYRATDMYDLVRVGGPFFVATQLDDLCLHSANPSARFAACFTAAEYFPGRCGAYQLARKTTADGFGGGYLDGLFTSCRSEERYDIEDLRLGGELPRSSYGSSLAPRHRRETLRVYASALDQEVHNAACEIAATTPESRNIPECSGFKSAK